MAAFPLGQMIAMNLNFGDFYRVLTWWGELSSLNPADPTDRAKMDLLVQQLNVVIQPSGVFIEISGTTQQPTINLQGL
jgi:hypothetical protein